MKKNLLIVDDDFDTRFILKKVLENEGYGVSLAQNEIETFETLIQYIGGPSKSRLARSIMNLFSKLRSIQKRFPEPELSSAHDTLPLASP